MSEIEVPMIDLSPWFSGGEAGRAAVVENVRTACIKCGFFVITKHGVDPDVIETTWKATRAFFDTDLLNKEAVAMGDSQPYGYSGMEKEVTGQDLEYGKGGKTSRNHISQITNVHYPTTSKNYLNRFTDLKESFAVALGPAVGRSEAMPADRWPENPRGYAEATTAYYREMEKLSEQLLRILVLGLSLPEDFIGAKQRHHWSALRSL
jgi:isopenicillin N synthase-like dioxygenase